MLTFKCPNKAGMSSQRWLKTTRSPHKDNNASGHMHTMRDSRAVKVVSVTTNDAKICVCVCVCVWTHTVTVALALTETLIQNYRTLHQRWYLSLSGVPGDTQVHGWFNIDFKSVSSKSIQSSSSQQLFTERPECCFQWFE